MTDGATTAPIVGDITDLAASWGRDLSAGRLPTASGRQRGAFALTVGA